MRACFPNVEFTTCEALSWFARWREVERPQRGASTEVRSYNSQKGRHET